jgi:serine/threonine protein kinase
MQTSMSEQENKLAANTILDDRYRIISEQSSYDLGNAYWAYDMQYDRQVSLLVLARRWGGGGAALERIQQAQRDLRSLDAPRLVPTEDVGSIGEQIYLVRAPSQGPTLAELLEQRGRIEVSSAVWITIQLCEALAPAHRAGLVHGGLSAQSVLVAHPAATDPATDPVVSLLDAGLLPALREVSASRDEPWGRPPYLSPEQAAGGQVHPPSDVYIIGSLLYEMLAGRPPFRTTDDAILTLQHLRQQPPSLQVLVPTLAPPLVEIIRRTLAKEPSARYRNAGQLAQILRSQVAAKLPPPWPAEPAAPSVPAFSKAQERLVVPPPPAPTMATTWSSGDLYEFEGDESRSEESAGVDWLMVALFIAALLAVLGLIPLWRSVYRRYATPPPMPAPGAHHRHEWDTSLMLRAAQSRVEQIQEQTKLGTCGPVWYNGASEVRGLSQVRSVSGRRQFCYAGPPESRVLGSLDYGFPRQDVVHFLGRV